MTHDRVGSDEFHLTHEFLGFMLGTRRASVSEALGQLKKANVLRSHRGDIHIIDRKGLHRHSCECTVKAVHVVLHKAFGAAVRWGRLSRNPADLADPPRVPKKPDSVETWSSEALREFLAHSASSGDREHALWVLLATTGMRRGEALGLRWQDVDLEAGTLAVLQTIQTIGGKLLVSEPKSDAGRRPIAIDKSTAAALRDHRKRMLEERMLVGADFSDEGLIFHRPDGSALRPERVSTAFLRRQKDLGLPRLTIKGLRHTWATLALKAGIHPKICRSASATRRSASPSTSTATPTRRSTPRPPSRSPG